MLNQITGDDGEVLTAVANAFPDVGAILSFTRRHIPASKRQISPYQAAALAYHAHQHDHPGARFLEVGTALGYSACILATAAPQATITTLNPKDGEFERARANLKIRSNVRVVKLTSDEFLAAGRQGDASARGPYDLIFIDGDHAYPMVLHDSQFFEWLAPGGLIIFHDYSPDDSTRPSGGCYRALNDLQLRHRQADVRIIGSGKVGMLGWIRQPEEQWT